MNIRALRRARRLDLAGWSICIRMTRNEAWRTGCDACSPARPTNPNIACAARMGNTAGFALALFRCAIRRESSSSGTGRAQTFTTASCWSNRFVDNAIELERMVDLRTAELRRLSSRLMTLQDEERRRIAREIHDGLGQEFAAAKMILDGILSKDSSPAMRQAALTRANWWTARSSKSERFRIFCILLCWTRLDSFPRFAGIWKGFRSAAESRFSLEVDPPDLSRLKPELETAIFRIIQEALTNMFRHSGARNGRVSLVEDDGRIMVTVRDDGKGIEEQVIQLRPDSVGVGIGGMRQRVNELGGSLRLANANPGTIVEVVIPSKQAQQRLVPSTV